VGSNINTNESYKGYSTEKDIELAKLEKGKSIEGSILMEMPDDVHSFNLNIPSTQAFKNVPIE
jgi:beta-galactosidase beta subunit